MEQIQVTIYILPYLSQQFQEVRDKLIDEFKLLEYNYEIFDDIIFFHFKINLVDNKHQFEDFLDHLRSVYTKLRYIIKIYEHNKKYPESIRINKLYTKIYTKNQTKYLGF